MKWKRVLLAGMGLNLAAAEVCGMALREPVWALVFAAFSVGLVAWVASRDSGGRSGSAPGTGSGS